MRTATLSELSARYDAGERVIPLPKGRHARAPFAEIPTKSSGRGIVVCRPNWEQALGRTSFRITRSRSHLLLTPLDYGHPAPPGNPLP